MKLFIRIKTMIRQQNKRLFSKTKNLKHVGIGCYIPQRYIDICGNNIIIGDYVSIGPNCKFDLSPSADIKIGNGTVIAPRCTFYTRTHAYDRKGLESIPFDSVSYCAEITIGEGCWLGDSVIVLPGVNIGNGAVIGAGSIVTKDIPAYAVAVGNPAKVVKYRDSERFEKLLSEQKYQLKINAQLPKKKEYIQK